MRGKLSSGSIAEVKLSSGGLLLRQPLALPQPAPRVCAASRALAAAAEAGLDVGWDLLSLDTEPREEWQRLSVMQGVQAREVLLLGGAYHQQGLGFDCSGWCKGTSAQSKKRVTGCYISQQAW